MKTRLLSIVCSMICATAVTGLTNSPVAADDQPNIVVILADDFGVGDIQAHYPDNKIATPHLDRLVSRIPVPTEIRTIAPPWRD